MAAIMSALSMEVLTPVMPCSAAYAASCAFVMLSSSAVRAVQAVTVATAMPSRYSANRVRPMIAKHSLTAVP